MGWCTLLNCAEKHGESMCSDCQKFPCREFDPKVGMFSEMYMNYIKDEIKPA